MPAAVDAMSRSASRERLGRPAARAAANICPYMRAASASNGNGSHVAVAQFGAVLERVTRYYSTIREVPNPPACQGVSAILDQGLARRC